MLLQRRVVIVVYKVCFLIKQKISMDLVYFITFWNDWKNHVIIFGILFVSVIDNQGTSCQLESTDRRWTGLNGTMTYLWNAI